MSVFTSARAANGVNADSSGPAQASTTPPPDKPLGTIALWLSTALAENSMLWQREFGVTVVTGTAAGLNSRWSVELKTVGPSPEGRSHQ
jgi:hypothetical protein